MIAHPQFGCKSRITDDQSRLPCSLFKSELCKMSPYKVAAFFFAMAGLATALNAARLWLEASNHRLPPLSVSIGDSPEMHLQHTQSELSGAALLNARAARWTGASAVLSAIASIVGLVE
jgi:hypothetical protein